MDDIVYGGDVDSKIKEIAMGSVLNQKCQLTFRETIRADLARLGSVSIKGFLKQYLLPRGATFPYIFWLRVMQFLRARGWASRMLAMVLYPIYRHYEFKYGIHANPNIRIGGGLCVVHGGNVHLNCESIGENLTVYQGVTLGIHDGKLPVVGNNVTIYPNSIVVGGIIIGDGARIGALSYVSHDVLPGVTIVGRSPCAIKEGISQ